MRKATTRVWSGAFALLACIGMFACGPSPEPGEPGSSPSVRQSGTHEQPAQRIVSLAPHLTELVFAAGAGDRLVGAVKFSDYPSAARDLPRVGDAFRLDYEALASLEPDLVLGWSGGNPQDLLERVRGLGWRLVTLEAASLEGVAEQLLMLGKLAGSEKQAALAAKAYSAELAELRRQYSDRTPVTVFYQVSPEPLLTINDEHVIGQGLRLCGGLNPFGSLPGLAPPVTEESVLDAAPQAMLAGDLGFGDDALLRWQRWSDLPAVKHGRLYRVPADYLSRPGPRLVRGIAAVCDALDRARTLSPELSPTAVR